MPAQEKRYLGALPAQFFPLSEFLLEIFQFGYL